jgi:gas vesicle protein
MPRVDYLDEYLDHYESLCTKYRDAYNIFAVKLKNRHNMITLPLLVITSATGVIASLQINRITGIIVGASSAVLTAVQRYCSYAERSENARMTAKSYSKTIRKIGNMKLIRRSEMVMTSNDIFAKFLREVQAEVDSAQENAQDVPWELLQYIDTIDTSVCCFQVKGTKTDRSLNGIPLNRVVAADV